MQLAEKKNTRTLRRFKVAVVGASKAELEIVGRIFTVTNYRTRSYVPVSLPISPAKLPSDIDFVLICSPNPNVINAWHQFKKNYTHESLSVPFIYLARAGNVSLGRYQLTSPVNPSKFIKMLDQYTIRELHYFPEFEIGSESSEIEDGTISGIKILKSSCESSSESRGLGSRALVVDDSMAVRRQMEIEFSMLNRDLDVAASAEEALEVLQERKYDVIFLDVVMPGIDGYSACKKIKRNALNKNTPVIMLTSRSSSFDKIKGAHAGCDAYLVKPINHNEFESVYNKYIS